MVFAQATRTLWTPCSVSLARQKLAAATALSTAMVDEIPLHDSEDRTAASQVRELTEQELKQLEGRLRAALESYRKRSARFSMIEVVDVAGLWPAPFETLAPIASGVLIERLLQIAPSVACAVAAEVGFGFRGVGTMFWSRLETVLGVAIAPVRRHDIGRCFVDLANDYALCRPSESAFSLHFSIMAWPLSNALMPLDLAAPVGRLLARGPLAALPAKGRTADLEALRAWAAAVEGARLVDWLRIEDPAVRVITALMTDNQDEVLSPRSFERIQAGIKAQKEAFLAVRSARARMPAARLPSRSEQAPGWLTLTLGPGPASLFVTWPSLSSAALVVARASARAAGWRPKLWGAGPALHPDAALGPGPMRISLEAPPAAAEKPYVGIEAVFGSGGEVAEALSSRNVDWGLCLAFEPDPGRIVAEQRVEALEGATGLVWLAVAPDGPAPIGLMQLASVCGYRILEADLGSDRDRRALTEAGLLSDEPQLRTARHPVDAVSGLRRTVSAARPFLVYDGRQDAGQGEVRTLRPGTHKVSLAGGGTIDIVARHPAAVAIATTIDISLLERDTAFEALLAKRLQIRIESRQPVVDVRCRAMVEIDGICVAVGMEVVPELPVTFAAASKLLAPLYDDRVRLRLMAAGSGVLTLGVGTSASLSVELTQPIASVEWDGTEPTLVGELAAEGLASAGATSPHCFAPVTSVAPPARGATASGFMLPGGRAAHPLLVQTSGKFDLGDLTSQFGVDAGSRLMFDGGVGVAELARARVAWARARCDTLAAVGARTRVVTQFDSVLSLALCGREWQRRELAIPKPPSDPHQALWRTAMARGFVELPSGATSCDEAAFSAAFAKHVRLLDPDWPTPGVEPLEGAIDDALNAAFADVLAASHSRGELTSHDADDFDFGRPAEDWSAAAEHAVDSVCRADLAALLAPNDGAASLRRRSYETASVPELGEDLAAWTRAFALPRGRLTSETAVVALQLWLSPGACEDPDGAVVVAARDPFVARAVRYAALRVAPFLS